MFFDVLIRPAHIASTNSTVDCLWLLSLKRANFDVKNNNDETPIHLACKNADDGKFYLPKFKLIFIACALITNDLDKTVIWLKGCEYTFLDEFGKSFKRNLNKVQTKMSFFTQ